jgi:hypothetical protein
MTVEKASLGRRFFVWIIDYIFLFLEGTILGREAIMRFEKQSQYNWEHTQKSLFQ